MSTSIAELGHKNDYLFNTLPHVGVSATTFALSWQDPEDFVKDLKTFQMNRTAKDMVTDLSGAKQRWVELEKQLQTEKSKVFALGTSITPQGSNANWGRITQRDQMQGTTLRELEMDTVKTTTRVAKFDPQEFISSRHNSEEYKTKVYEEGELTAPIVKAIEEEADTITESEFFCKGCSKFFATKASLKRHHDRKKSCKDLCDISGNTLEVPDKPVITEWVDQLMTRAISGVLEGVPNDKPYCKHCDVEFANKSNLHKHLSKSVACDKLAKQDFLKLLA